MGLMLSLCKKYKITERSDLLGYKSSLDEDKIKKNKFYITCIRGDHKKLGFHINQTFLRTLPICPTIIWKCMPEEGNQT